MTDEREGMVSSAELCRCALARLGFEAQAAQRPEYEVAENADADHLATWCGSDFRESLLKSCGTLAKGRKSHESCGTLAKGRESHESCGSIDV